MQAFDQDWLMFRVLAGFKVPRHRASTANEVIDQELVLIAKIQPSAGNDWM